VEEAEPAGWLASGRKTIGLAGRGPDAGEVHAATHVHAHTRMLLTHAPARAAAGNLTC
jgi:hypothetical protein